MKGSVFPVIVNYRTADLAVDCLRSLGEQVADLAGGRVIVVDNCSGDDSVAVLRAAIRNRGWGEWVEVVSGARNGGFAFGNNAGIARVRELDPNFYAVLMLNPDTVVLPGAVRHLVSFLRGDAGAGIAGAQLQNREGRPEPSAHREPSPVSELKGAAQLGIFGSLRVGSGAPGPGSRPQQCDWTTGACMAVRREVFDAIGPLDEGYFLYFEEVDFCVRARRAGWSCWFVPEAAVVHIEGAATGIRAPGRPRPSYWYASRRRFFVKRYGVFGLIAADVLWMLGRLSLVTRRALGLGGRAGISSEPARVARDLLLGDLRALWHGELARIPRHS